MWIDEEPRAPPLEAARGAAGGALCACAVHGQRRGWAVSVKMPARSGFLGTVRRAWHRASHGNLTARLPSPAAAWTGGWEGSEGRGQLGFPTRRGSWAAGWRPGPRLLSRFTLGHESGGCGGPAPRPGPVPSLTLQLLVDTLQGARGQTQGAP